MMPRLDDLPPNIEIADLVDAMGRLHRHRCHILDLATPSPGRILFGPAVTVSYFPTCEAARPSERYNFAKLFYEAVGDDPAGRVLVLASNGHPDVSLGGGRKLSRVHDQGLAGVLTDGRLRDFGELASYDFATYCAGEATKWGGDIVTPFQANVPVVLSGVGIVPGDFIYASGSAAVVIPGSEVSKVIEGAVRVAEEDAAHREMIEREDPTSPSWE